MKKLYSKLWLAVIFILILSASFSSCKKDKDLDGTAWEWKSDFWGTGSNDFIHIGEYFDHYSYILYCTQITVSFSDSGANIGIGIVAYYPAFNNWANPQYFSDLGETNYAYKGKNITLDVPPMWFFSEQTWTGTVKKNTIYLENVFGSNVELNKQ